jgi:hypothetical protein
MRGRDSSGAVADSEGNCRALPLKLQTDCDDSVRMLMVLQTSTENVLRRKRTDQGHPDRLGSAIHATTLKHAPDTRARRSASANLCTGRRRIASAPERESSTSIVLLSVVSFKKGAVVCRRLFLENLFYVATRFPVQASGFPAVPSAGVGWRTRGACTSHIF